MRVFKDLPWAICVETACFRSLQVCAATETGKYLFTQQICIKL